MLYSNQIKSNQIKKYLLFRAKQKYNFQFIQSWDETKEPAEASLWDAGPVDCNPNVETENLNKRALDDNHEDKTNKNYNHYQTE